MSRFAIQKRLILLNSGTYLLDPVLIAESTLSDSTHFVHHTPRSPLDVLLPRKCLQMYTRTVGLALMTVFLRVAFKSAKMLTLQEQ